MKQWVPLKSFGSSTFFKSLLLCGSIRPERVVKREQQLFSIFFLHLVSKSSMRKKGAFLLLLMLLLELSTKCTTPQTKSPVPLVYHKQHDTHDKEKCLWGKV